jgi:hypothetical protein
MDKVSPASDAGRTGHMDSDVDPFGWCGEASGWASYARARPTSNSKNCPTFDPNPTTNPTCKVYAEWPNLKSTAVCAPCTAVVATTPFQTCGSYCASFDSVCMYAAEDESNDCTVLKLHSCSDNIMLLSENGKTSDMICGCKDVPTSTTAFTSSMRRSMTTTITTTTDYGYFYDDDDDTAVDDSTNDYEIADDYEASDDYEETDDTPSAADDVDDDGTAAGYTSCINGKKGSCINVDSETCGNTAVVSGYCAGANNI